MERKINDQLAIEKVDAHFCLVRKEKEDQKKIELCFYSVADALSYASERNYK